MPKFQNIVVGIDVSDADHLVALDAILSPTSRGALEKAAWVARRNGGKLHVLTTLDVDVRAEALIRKEFASGADNVLRAARDRLGEIVAPLRDEGLAVTLQVAFGRTAAAVLADVERSERDLVVVGTRERGALARNLLGSTSLQLLRRCPVAVWVARSAPHAKVAVILAPVDVGDMADVIVRVAMGLAESFGARLVVHHAVDPVAERVARSGGADERDVARVAQMRRDGAKAAIQLVVAQHARPGVVVDERITCGDAADEILAMAARVDADLVVLSSVVHSAVGGIFLGSTTEKVLPRLGTSLLVLKPTRPD